jgi:hypothetical protein
MGEWVSTEDELSRQPVIRLAQSDASEAARHSCALFCFARILANSATKERIRLPTWRSVN